MTERRVALEVRTAGRSKLEGYAALFNSMSEDLGGFVEVIRPGAFRRALAGKPDVMALYEHDTRHILGRTKADTLKLAEDAKGLHFEIDVPDTSTGRDLLVSVGRGDIRGASFAFTAREDVWTQGNSGLIRELIDVDLLDVTVTATPAYSDTEVARRALAKGGKHTRLQLFNRYRALMEAI
jgi:uncharacterized protein